MTEADSLAHAAISATLGAIALAGDARKADAYAACFTEDGVLELDRRIEGREAIRQWMAAPSVIAEAAGGSPGFVSHHITSRRIEVSGDTASVRAYFLVTAANGLDHNGYYNDVFRKVGDAWLIAHRKPRTLWIALDSVLNSGRNRGGRKRD